MPHLCHFKKKMLNSHDLINNNINFANSYGSPTWKACRTYSELPARRIFGGQSAASGEFPWMVFLKTWWILIQIQRYFIDFIFSFKAALGYLQKDLSIIFACGGTIISEKFILTASHCFKQGHYPVVARLGEVNKKINWTANCFKILILLHFTF